MRSTALDTADSEDASDGECLPPDAPILPLADGLPAPRRYFATATIFTTVILSSLGISIVNVILPSMANSLRIEDSQSIWVVTVYQIAMVAGLLPFASLGEIYGYRRVYIAGMALFTLTSLGVSLSDSFAAILVWRTLQGVGAALMLSVNLAILRQITPKARLGRMLGINAFAAAVSATAGPPIASALLHITDWRDLFLINVPIGLIATVLAVTSVPRLPRAARTFDLRAAGLHALVFSLILLVANGIAYHQDVRLVAAEIACVLPLAWIHFRRETRQEAPLFPVDLLRISVFRLSVSASICAFAAQMVIFIVLPFHLENTVGMPATEVGYVLSPWPAATMAAALISGRLADRFSPAWLGAAGMALLACGLIAMVTIGDHPGHLDYAWRMALAGFGFGLFQTPNNKMMISSAPVARSGAASGSLGTARMLGQSAGAVLAAMLLVLDKNAGELNGAVVGTVLALVAMVLSFLRRPARH